MSNIAKVIAETLSDKSKVYSVRLPCADGGFVILACAGTEENAESVANAIRACVIDVSLRD